MPMNPEASVMRIDIRSGLKCWIFFLAVHYVRDSSVVDVIRSTTRSAYPRSMSLSLPFWGGASELLFLFFAQDLGGMLKVY